VFIFGQIESGNDVSAAQVSVLILTISLVILVGISLLARRSARHGA
jgi:ABC-type sulfate transport system permease component